MIKPSSRTTLAAKCMALFYHCTVLAEKWSCVQFISHKGVSPKDNMTPLFDFGGKRYVAHLSREEAILNKKIKRAGLFAIILGSISFPAVTAELDFPRPGVICDPVAKYCVDKQGLSLSLTQLYLGIDARQHLRNELENDDKVNKHEFTFSNGVHCDTTKKQCYRDRYYPRTPDKQEIPLTQYLFGQSAASVKP